MSTAGGPIIEASREPEEYQQALKIILGTVVGVIALVGIIALVLLLYRLWKKQRYEESERRRRVNNARSVSIDLSQKQVPSVLLLYSDDLPVHEKVAQSLAGFLIESCDCNVYFDLFEEQIIHNRGLDTWLVERLQESDIIMVLCSVGARLRCCKKRTRFKESSDRTIPDYFAVAVDYVGEKMRVERRKDQSLSRFVTVYMDYSTASDIPPQLETASRFCLMKDINKLYNYIHGLDESTYKIEDNFLVITDNNYQKTEVGTELLIAVEQAKEYFRKNPNWVDDRLEQIPVSKPRHRRNNSLEQPLLNHHGTSDLPKTTSSQITCNALIEIHTLPRQSNDIDSTYNSLPYSRQNSLPSLNSHVNNGQISSNQIKISKSYEMIPLGDRHSDFESRPCNVCLQSSHTQGKHTCPNINQRKPAPDIDEDLDLTGRSKCKSKSMPTVCANNLTSSQTVFQAEVHKAWDDGGEGGRCSPTDSQDTESNQGSDTLERDIRSITMPPTFDNVHYSVSSYLLNDPCPPTVSLVHSKSDHRIKPVPTLVPMESSLEDDQLFFMSSSAGDIMLKEFL